MFGTSFGSTLSKLGQVAEEVSQSLDGGIQSVALNIGQAIRENIRGGGANGPEEENVLRGSSHSSRRGSGSAAASARRAAGTTSSNSTSSSTVATPDSEEEPSSSSRPPFPSSSMGSGPSSGPQPGSSSSAGGTSGQDMSLCDQCSVKFNIFNKKRQCCICRCCFCSNCTSRCSTGGRVCVRCKVLINKPPVRADLMQLKVKDLQRYLVSKDVNTKACVEKKDLVELVIRENGGVSRPTSASAAGEPSSSTSPSPSNAAGSRRDPIERQRSFPKSYIESTHRREWFENHEKADEGDDDTTEEGVNNATTANPGSTATSPNAEDLVRDFVVVPPINEGPAQPDITEQSPVDPIPAGATGPASPIRTSSSTTSSSKPVTPTTAREFPGRSEASNAERDEAEVALEATEEHKNKPENDRESSTKTPGPASSPLPVPTVDGAAAASGSPRRFANQGLVYLSEITSLDDLNELSVKQIKEILAMNRVNFKGVVEKDELLKIVRRLWTQEMKLKDDKDNMEDSDLCKICMDNPVDCVMLECGHMCTCTQCGKQMAECPMCRQYVVRVVKTFKS